MTLSAKLSALFCISVIFVACQSTRPVAGKYHSKFSEMMMFGHTITLKADSTILYVFQGDLRYENATGHYTIFDGKVFATFNPEAPDSLTFNYHFADIPLRTHTFRGKAITCQLMLYIGKNKLYPAFIETDKKITRETKYNKRRKYIFFGPHNYKRHFYYKRVS